LHFAATQSNLAHWVAFFVPVRLGMKTTNDKWELSDLWGPYDGITQRINHCSRSWFIAVFWKKAVADFIFSKQQHIAINEIEHFYGE